MKNLSREAILLLAKASEMFTTKLGLETIRIAQVQNRRKLLPEDVADAVRVKDQFLFLKEDIRDIVRDQLEEKKLQLATRKLPESKRVKVTVGKDLTAYFGTN